MQRNREESNDIVAARATQFFVDLVRPGVCAHEDSHLWLIHFFIISLECTIKSDRTDSRVEWMEVKVRSDPRED